MGVLKRVARLVNQEVDRYVRIRVREALLQERQTMSEHPSSPSTDIEVEEERTLQELLDGIRALREQMLRDDERSEQYRREAEAYRQETDRLKKEGRLLAEQGRLLDSEIERLRDETRAALVRIEARLLRHA